MVDYFQQVKKFKIYFQQAQKWSIIFNRCKGLLKMRLYIQQAQQVQKVQNIFSTGKKGIVHETKYLTLTLTIQQVIQRKFFFNR